MFSSFHLLRQACSALFSHSHWFAIFNLSNYQGLFFQKKNTLALLFFFCFAKLVLAQSPGGVTGSAIWLKANTGVTTGATFTWADQSGNSRNGTQTTAANQPTLTATSINYNPAVTFDGTSDRLNLASLAGLPTGTGTVDAFAVARNLNTAGGWMHIISYGGTAANSFFTLGKQTGTANAVCAFNASDAISSAGEYANSTPALTNGKYTGTQGIILSNGVQRGTITFTAVKATTAGRVGCDPVDASFWNGNVAEAIIFPGNLSASNVLNINSYLALKYGITLDQTTATNYVASDWNGSTGTIFWNGSTNSGNKNNIAGIGRDDNSDLNQKQSKSVNTASSGDLVAMGLGAIATNNAGNANTFSADKSFLVWGDNAGANAWQSTESPSALRQRLTREWKVQETGTVGNVEIQVQDNSASSGGELPAETGTVYLLVDADGDFSSGATEYAMTLTGTNWEVTVDLADGQFFTFATQVLPSPGGVAANKLWLKADVGTGTTTEGGAITTWADQSGNSNNATTTTNSGFTTPTSAGATFRSASGSNGMNFNPTVDFSTNKSLDGTGGLSTKSVFFVFNLRTTATTVAVVGYDDATPGGAGGGVQAYGRFNATNVAHVARNSTSNNFIGGVQNYTISGTTPTIFDGQHVSNSSSNLMLNGIGTSTITTLGTPPSPYIGSYRLGATSDNQFQYGNILPEVISFDANLTTSERLRVSSYLAIKWGITLGTTASVSDYQNSAGTTIWTGSATYQNNIAGIGRDDLSALNQKQSCSINTTSSGDLVAMGLGTVATDNASNANTFSADKSYLIWGDNAGANAWQNTEAPASRQRLTREWIVQETGTVGNVLVRVQDDGASSGAELPAEVTTVYILVDADGDFSSGATEYSMTLASNYWTATVDFTSGQFFTFATQTPPAPGGVFSNMVLWLKPDAGALNGSSPATNGQTVTTWQDQTTGANHFTTASAEGVITGAPTWAEVATNFNPALAFNGTQGLHRTANIYTNNSNLSIFNVHRNTSGGGTVIFTNNANDAPNPLHQTWGYNQWTTTSSQFSVPASGSTKTNVYGLTRLNTSGSNYTVTTYFEGKATAATAVALNFATNNNKMTIGYRSHSTNASLRSPHTDQINELIIYTAELAATEQQRVNTYLALKYGTTLDQTTAYNYLASDGSTIFWDGTSNSSYKNNIAGIARDDNSELDQKQSQSVNTSSSGDLVTMGLGTIVASNAANSNVFSADKSALVWGDNAGSTTVSTTISGSPISRMSRIWKTQETGTVGTVKIRIPTTAITLGTGETAYLLKSTDATFTNSDPTFPLTVNGSFYETTLDFATGDYFTFGKNLDADVTLALTMTGSPASVTTGQNITYTLTLTNSGTSTATTVKVKDQLPGGVNFVSATPSTGTYNSATGIWTIPSIAPGSQTLTIVVTAQ